MTSKYTGEPIEMLEQLISDLKARFLKIDKKLEAMDKRIDSLSPKKKSNEKKNG